MESSSGSEQDLQLVHLIHQQLTQLLNDKDSETTQQSNGSDGSSNTNTYFDKQLTHLVISQQFNFNSISNILKFVDLAVIFQNDKIDTSKKACRKRWTYLYKNREKISEIKEKTKQDKRAKSIAAFSHPYSLYSVEQLIQNLQEAEKKSAQINSVQNKTVQNKIEPITNSGYNIMKDSFRKITNFQQYTQRQTKMKQALQRAKNEVDDDKPLYFSPQYEKLEQFEVKGEELTPEKMKQIVAYQIQMENLKREIIEDIEVKEEKKYDYKMKKKIQREHSMSNQQGDIKENWDEYESD